LVAAFVPRCKSSFIEQEKLSMLRIFVVLTAVIVTLATASAATADPPQPLGGLNLGAYCQAKGFDGDISPRGQLAHHAAVQNWRCATASGESQPINMRKACTWHYGQSAQARFSNVHDAYTWLCYSVGNE
jgi:hypothetical protein